jgi:hypothetical protein
LSAVTGHAGTAASVDQQQTEELVAANVLGEHCGVSLHTPASLKASTFVHWHI